MSKIKSYIYIVGAVAIFYSLIVLLSPKNINWDLSLKPDDTNPYGTYILKESLEDLFPNSKISENKKNFFFLNNETENSDSPKTVIIINNYSNLDKYSINELLKFVENGNTVLYSSNNIDDFLLDSLNIKQHYLNVGYTKVGYIPLYLTGKHYLEEDSVHFKYNYYKYFDNLGPLKFDYEVLGKCGATWNKNPNFIRVDIGDGHLFLHSSPLAFTNFNILKNYTKTYTEDVLSMVQNKEVIWDYTMDKTVAEDSSIFKVIFKYKTIKYAYFLIILLIILYAVTNFFRQQRLIPIVEPLKNSSMELVNSISELYIHQADHKNLSEKIIRHFSDYILRKYQINTGHYDDHFVEKLKNKSQRDIKEIKELLEVINRVQSKTKIGYEDVLELHQKIENFKSPENN